MVTPMDHLINLSLYSSNEMIRKLDIRFICGQQISLTTQSDSKGMNEFKGDKKFSFTSVKDIVNATSFNHVIQYFGILSLK